MTAPDGWFDGLTPVPVECAISEVPDSFYLFADLTYRVTGAGSAGATAAVRLFLDWIARVRRQSIDARATSEENARLRVECAAPGGEVPGIADDESYELSVDGGRGRIRLAATRPVGVLRGLATLLQLSLLGAGNVRGCEIVDRPRFAWRGLMIDVARHFIPLPLLHRTLDAMALCKLNVLHLHLTDDQGFRIESRAFPQLHGKGSDGEYYTQDEIRALVGFAGARGIRVVPEFDVPGHASSWLVGFPHLGCRPEAGYRIQDAWGCHDVCLNPANEEVYEFLDRFFGDVLPLFPDAVVHIGGDEVKGDEWRATPDVVAFMAANGIADTNALQAHFNARVRDILRRRGKRMMGWDEIADGGAAEDDVVQTWRGADSTVRLAAEGYACVRSHGYYLDALLPAAEHHAVDPADGVRRGADRVLGGEACMWTEYVDRNNLESRLWPRAAAMAERWWSPRRACDPATLPDRLAAVTDLLQRLGVAVTGEGSAARRKLSMSAVGAGLVAAPRVTGESDPERDRHTPLDGLADQLPVESPLVWFIQRSVRTGDFAELARWFETKSEGGGGLWRRHLGREGDVLWDRLRSTAAIGGRAAAGLSDRTRVDARWVGDALAELELCAEPCAGIAVGLTGAVADLVRALPRDPC